MSENVLFSLKSDFDRSVEGDVRGRRVAAVHVHVGVRMGRADAANVQNEVVVVFKAVVLRVQRRQRRRHVCQTILISK